jgi:hypothetical protein
MVESLPKSIKILLDANGGSFNFSVEKTGAHELTIISRIQIKQTLFSPDEYPALKEMMSRIREKMGELIVLKKDN